MKKINSKLLLAFLFGAAMLASCSKEETTGGSARQITISPIITKATELNFEDGDKIGLTVTKQSDGSVHATNAPMTYGSGIFSGNLGWYEGNSDKATLTAYYPYSSTGVPASFSVKADQTTGYAQSDLIASRTPDVLPTADPIVMTFKHILTKIMINVANESGANISSVVLKGSIPTGDVDLETLTATVSQTAAADIKAQQVTANTLYRAIVIPQTVAFTVAVETSAGKTFTQTLASAALVPGGQYNVNVKVTSDGMTVSLSGDIDNWTNEGEIGAGNGNENPDDEYTPPTVGSVELDKLYGYATLGSGTSGGADATPANIFHFDDGAKLTVWLNAREKAKSTVPAIVWLSGTFNKNQGRAPSSPWFDVKRTQNISFYGVNGFKMENVGFFLNEAKNIIIRNIHIQLPKADNGADGISMQESSNIWVDHCTFESVNQTSDYEDGSCDVTHQTHNVTISWCRFIKTQKTCLIGHSDSQTADVVLSATLHHNFFDNSSSRHPRVRYGRAHVYNNFYNAVTTYGAGSAFGAKVLVEENYFDGVHLPTDICTFPAKKSGSSWVSNLTGKSAGYLFASNNHFVNKPANASDPYPFVNVQYEAYNGTMLAAPLTYNDFKPSYPYVVDAADQVATIVTSGAGVGKLPDFGSAPIAVNNGGIADGEVTDPGTGGGGEEPAIIALANGWALVNFGTAAGSAAVSEGTLALTAQGKFESGKQTFAFVYREVTGNFTLTARLNSFAPPTDTNQGLAGLMMAPSLSTTDNDFVHGMAAASKSSYYASYRLKAAANRGSSSMTAPAVTGGNTYLKLVREGDKYSASYSLDGGETWGAVKNNTFDATATLPATIYVGFATSSASTSATATATFSDVKLNDQTLTFAED